ncbi:helix-turn-helix transcriptional regulator [Streptomyces fodineus]|uniref:helix-turn-helix transcriptional regulator n=1 Tax=Streptomyces fodineus TaxID=1904616 RepID=UPI001D050959|nr:helix-turn-helix transcriptional regulator [Streptomyces fodineus]
MAALHEQDPEQLWSPLAVEILRVCGAEFLVFVSRDWVGCEDAVHVWLPDGTVRSQVGEHAQQLIRHCKPLTGYYATSNDRTPVTASQVVGEAEWRDSVMAQRKREALASDHILGVPLPDASEPFRGCLVHRTGSGFTDEHLAFARRIQPLLAGVDRQAALLRNYRASTAKAPSGQAGPDPAEGAAESGLTPRETDVLALLADALTATAISRRLGISVRTVQKHTENIYRKLGTSDRVTTVLHAQARRIIPVREVAARPTPGRSGGIHSTCR